LSKIGLGSAVTRLTLSGLDILVPCSWCLSLPRLYSQSRHENASFCYPFPISRVKEVHVVSILTLSNLFGAPGSLGPGPGTSHTRSLTIRRLRLTENLQFEENGTSKSMYPIYSSRLYDNAIYCDIRYRADPKQGLRSSSSHCRQLPQVSLPMRHVTGSLQGANCR
jgi:hypothetical protein